MNSNKKGRDELKKYFSRNALPTESNFADLIDAALNQNDDGIVKAAREPLNLEAANTPGQQAINFYASFDDAQPAWTLSLPPASAAADAGSRNSFDLRSGDAAPRLFIDAAAGNVGIGTDSPQTALDVNGGAQVRGSLQVQAGATIAGGPLTVCDPSSRDTPASGRQLLVHLKGRNAVPIPAFPPSFGGNDDRPALALSGDYPEISLFSLQPAGHGPVLRFGGYDSTKTRWSHWSVGTVASPAEQGGAYSTSLHFGYAADSPNPHFGLGNAGAMTLLSLSSEGKVGVRTTSPQAALDVNGDARVQELAVGGALRLNSSDLYFTKTDHVHTTIGNAPGCAAIENASSHNALMILGRATDQGRQVRIFDDCTVNRRLGVDSDLSVGGTGTIRGPLQAQAGATISGGSLTVEGQATQLHGDVLTSGRVGIGTDSPQAALDVKGDAQVRGSLQAQAGATVAGGPLTVEGQTTQLNGDVLTSGRVGIGTDSPQAALDVNGDAQVRGTLQAQAGATISGPFTVCDPSSRDTPASGRQLLVHLKGRNAVPIPALPPSFGGNDDRPALALSGDYPEISLFSLQPAGHGPVLRFGGYDSNQARWTHWSVGTVAAPAKPDGAYSTSLHFGYAADSPNPHFGLGNAGATTLLSLSSEGKVGVRTTSPQAALDVDGDARVQELAVGGALRLNSSDLYFTKTDHVHTGIGNSEGCAAIENASSHNALMILGRATDQGRLVRIFDDCTVNRRLGVDSDLSVGGTSTLRGALQAQAGATISGGSLTVEGQATQLKGDVLTSGRVGIGTTSPQKALDVNGDAQVQELAVGGALRLNSSDLYFTKTDHVHTGIGNSEGCAAIENASSHGALMILGRASAEGRQVKIFDDCNVSRRLGVDSDLSVGGTSTLRGTLQAQAGAAISGGPLTVEAQTTQLNGDVLTGGRVGIGTSSPQKALDVNGDAQVRGTLQAQAGATITGGPLTVCDPSTRDAPSAGPQVLVHLKGRNPVAIPTLDPGGGGNDDRPALALSGDYPEISLFSVQPAGHGPVLRFGGYDSTKSHWSHWSVGTVASPAGQGSAYSTSLHFGYAADSPNPHFGLGNAGATTLLSLSSEGQVGVRTTSPQAALDVNGDARVQELAVGGALRLNSSDLYFTKTDHVHTTIGNAPGCAAIENASSHNALMILGRATDQGRLVKIFDDCTVDRRLSVDSDLSVGGTGTIRGGLLAKSGATIAGGPLTVEGQATQLNGDVLTSGRVGIGTQDPQKALDVQGDAQVKGLTIQGANPAELALPADSADRPRLTINGDCPELNLVTRSTNNQEGPVIRLIGVRQEPALNAGGTNQRQIQTEWQIGTIPSVDGGGHLDFGYKGDAIPSPNSAINSVISSGMTSMRLTQSGELYIRSINHENAWGTSDQTLKESIEEMHGVLDQVNQLKPVRFTWKSDQRRDIGFIAQDVEPLFPEIVGSKPASFAPDETRSVKTLAYNAFGPIAIAAIQELAQKVSQLADENQQLKARLAALEDRLR